MNIFNRMANNFINELRNALAATGSSTLMSNLYVVHPGVPHRSDIYTQSESSRSEDTGCGLMKIRYYLDLGNKNSDTSTDILSTVYNDKKEVENGYFSLRQEYKSTQEFSKIYKDHCFRFDRVLDGENEVFIGIVSFSPRISSQGIRIGGLFNKIHRLLESKEEENKLFYKFENNVTMILEKKDEKIIMNIIDPTQNKTIIKEIDPIIINHYKPINLTDASNELDRIHKLFTKESCQ